MPQMITNDTPNDVEVTGARGRRIVLAPLEVQVLTDAEAKNFDFDKVALTGVLRTETVPEDDLASQIGVTLWIAGVFLGIVCLGLTGKEGPVWLQGSWYWKLGVWGIAFALLVFIVSAYIIIKKKLYKRVFRFLGQALSLVVILAIGFGVPAVTTYFFGGGRALIADPSAKLFARLLQVAFIAVASLMPVLLFFLFDRYQLNTLRNRLYHDLFRLDRELATRSQIDARYGSQIEETYGSRDEGRGRLTRGTRWPVLVCAVVITLGWIAAFKPVGELETAALAHPLFPGRNVFTFGFLGAYFFGLQLIARRYARGDLKPKAYGYITIRILIVAVLSWVLEVFSESSSVTLVIAFLIGILPDELFTWIRENFRYLGRMVPKSERHPLTNLEGIDLYDRARLEQEGIVNVESFAHHDLIQLVLETRIPVPQLVDWMDQAILYLHTVEESADEDETNKTNATENNASVNQVEPGVAHESKPIQPQTNLQQRLAARRQLRKYGIRTTTDLLTCWDAAEKRGPSDLEDFKKLLGGDRPYRLEIVKDALIDDEWLEYVWNWRNDTKRPPLTIDASRIDEAELAKRTIDTLEEMIEVRDVPEQHVHLARLLANPPVPTLRNVGRSREHAQRAFELGNDNPEVLKSLIDINRANGDTAEALRVCERAIEILSDPKHADAAAGTMDELRKDEAELKAKLEAAEKARLEKEDDAQAEAQAEENKRSRFDLLKRFRRR